MTNDTTQEENETNMPAMEVQESVVQEVPQRGPRRGRRDDRDPRGPRGPRRGGDAQRSEFAQKMLGIRRVARVMAGGRRFNFSVCMVLGDKKGRVGVGVGKAADTQLAIEKASRAARKNMITVDLTKNNSIKHNIGAKYSASIIEIRPSPGRGLVAGSAVRTVLELAGVTDVTAKVLSRSHNSINNARAAIEALKQVAKK
ncbi:MAG TPA: 30S ribosomal protein S5 [Candidatus Paceibacterota bacterium]|nr:30S ribosomal protein S5 [Candidatus Paceibacterota bacterium]